MSELATSGAVTTHGEPATATAGAGPLSTPVPPPAFQHRQTAHCESGVVAALLRERGVPLSEALVFGIGTGLTFAYLPMIRLAGQPLISYRMPPRTILTGAAKRLGIGVRHTTFRTPDEAMRALDARLAEGRVVGLQTSVFFLPYFPRDMRFHFNAHNLLVYGRQGDDTYLVSDPIFEQPVACPGYALRQARFARGPLAPKGMQYEVTHVPAMLPLERAVRGAIRFTSGMMCHTPIPIFGVRGIRLVANRLRALDPAQHERNRLLLGHIVRMQEEIGTGGAGFRFLYAAFLQEAAEILQRPALAESAAALTAVGDRWRRFALRAARMCKAREAVDYRGLAEELEAIAVGERGVFGGVRAIVG